jgi:TolA-binding protein
LTDRPAALAIVVAMALAVALAAHADGQVLFKLIDRKGRVTYSDTEPKNFDGEVIRLEPDTASNIMPGLPRPGRPPSSGPVKDGPSPRQVARAELEKRLRAAQDRVEAARKAKAEGEDPLPEELQTIQKRFAPLAQGQAAPGPSCLSLVDPHGAAFLSCPSRVPNEDYYARQKALDDALQQAEEELALAERAYRRGTD